jgi:DNA-binding NarL/FixJ family response regulator
MIALRSEPRDHGAARAAGPPAPLPNSAPARGFTPMKRATSPVPRTGLQREQDGDRPASVREAVETVARTLTRPLSAGEVAATTRVVYASSFVYEIRGRIFHAGDGDVAAILVTVDRQPAPPPEPETLREVFGLTRRQAAVAALLAAGLNNAEVARVLVISPHTARHHTEKVLQKLGVRSRHDVPAAVAAIDL